MGVAPCFTKNLMTDLCSSRHWCDMIGRVSKWVKQWTKTPKNQNWNIPRSVVNFDCRAACDPSTCRSSEGSLWSDLDLIVWRDRRPIILQRVLMKNSQIDPKRSAAGPEISLFWDDPRTCVRELHSQIADFSCCILLSAVDQSTVRAINIWTLVLDQLTGLGTWLSGCQNVRRNQRWIACFWTPLGVCWPTSAAPSDSQKLTRLTHSESSKFNHKIFSCMSWCPREWHVGSIAPVCATWKKSHRAPIGWIAPLKWISSSRCRTSSRA